MTLRTPVVLQWWRLVRKDLQREYRALHALPAMLLLGLVLVALIQLQLGDSPASTRQSTVGLVWLAVTFAGTLGLDRSFAGERDEGCGDALRMYPVGASVVFAAKAAVNFVQMSIVTGVLLPLFLVLSDAAFSRGVAPLLPVVLLANLGFAAIGTLMGALSYRLQRGGNWLSLLLLPLVVPLMLAAGEATRLTLEGDLGLEYGRWLQLMAAYAVMFLTAGGLTFATLMED